MFDVPFVETKTVTGLLEPDERELKSKGFRAPPGPLRTYVALGMPLVTLLTKKTAGSDGSVADLIAADAAHRFYHVRFSCTFHPTDGATFEKAWVLATLTAGKAGQPAPIALSLEPLRTDQPVELSESFELGVDFKFVNAKIGVDTKVPSSLIFAEGLNEGSSEPAWEFTQTRAQAIRGLQRLQMIVRTSSSGVSRGSIQLTASIARPGFASIPPRARFENQPEVAFALE
jgi:hypothetical protein